jgi:hypothetical protein
MVTGIHEQTEAVQESATAHGKHSAIIHEVSGELVGIASKWIGVAAAIDKAKEGFTDFAKDEETVRIIGARLGATHEQLEKFKESAEKMEAVFGTSFEKAAMTMEAFRKSAGLTVAQLRDVERVGPGIMEVAHRFGVDSTAMAETFGTFVRQMKIDPAQYEQALGAMGIAAQRLKIDFGQLNRTAPQLADSMAEVGLKGTSGLSQMLAILSMTRKEFGNMRSASGQLQSALSQVQSGGGVAAAFGMDAAQWSENTDTIIENGGNVFDYYIGKIKEARQEGYSWGELFNDPKQRRFWKMMVDDGSKFRELQEKITAESKDFHAGSTKDFENDAMALARLSQSLNELVKSFGGFMSAIGTADALRSLTKDLHDIISLVTKITELTNHFSWGKLAEMLPSVKDLRMPSMASIAQGILNGPNGDPKLHKNQYSLEMGDEENPERRALGGRVKAGRSYMVGESGRELFTPSTSGSITTNDTIKNVERHTDDTNTILTQIRDLLYKGQEGNVGGGGGSSGIGSSVGSSGSTGSGAGSNPMGIGSGGGTMSGGGPGSATAWDKMTKGTPLEGKWPQVEAAAKANGVPSAVMGGIILHETGMGKNTNKNNVAGLMDPKTNSSTKMEFGSIDEGITAAGRTIGHQYSKANGDIEAMGRSYAPVGAANDPGGLNSGWSGGVRKFAGKLGGTSGDAPPPALLDAARQAALSGGPDAVAHFMAKNGYPKNGSWCGEFAAAAVTAAGGTPPKNPAIASNWRNFGTEVSDPQPGDIAVRRGVPTGATGSHVTIVDSVNRGSFTGLGGNQSKMRSNYSQDRFQFFRGSTPAGGESDPTAQSPPAGKTSALDEARRVRAELEQPITIRAQLDRGSDSQFRRASMRREVNREVREASWSSYADIGSA